MSTVSLNDFQNQWKTSQFNEYLGEQENNSWVLYNNLSGAMLTLNRNLYRAMSSGMLNDILKHEHIEILSSRGFIVKNDVDEVDVLRKNKENHVQNVTAIGFQILPTLYCNFSCKYCYEPETGSFVKMSQKVMDRIINYLEEKIKPTTRFLSVMWFGGEPLLGIDCIRYLSKKFLSICKNHSIEYNSSITTNGYLLNGKNIFNCDFNGIHNSYLNYLKQYYKQKSLK